MKKVSTVLGKKVQLVIVDNKSDKVEAANAASRLVDKDKVVAIIGSYGSSLSMAAGDIVKNAKFRCRLFTYQSSSNFKQ